MSMLRPQERFGLCRVSCLPVNGGNAKLHSALLASRQGLRQQAAIHGQSLNHFALAAQGVCPIDLSLEDACLAIGRAGHAPKREGKDEEGDGTK